MGQAVFRDLAVFLQYRSWRDILDIAVVGFLLYRTLLLIRGTRAVQLIAGLGVLVLVGLTAKVLRLQLTYWIFSNLAPALLIGVVILFQPELRRALDRVGRVGMLGRPLAHYNLQLFGRLVDEVVAGVVRLSERRHGGLIVLERDVGLENYALTGVRINGEVTAEFLGSIFYPNSPLHDGAALIRGNRLVAAGCLLPLVEEMSVGGGRMGTRHRAALGLSLESDAIVIVVSEETGRISLARDGKLRQGLGSESLRQALYAILLPRQQQPGGGTRVFGRQLRRRATDTPVSTEGETVVDARPEVTPPTLEAGTEAAPAMPRPVEAGVAPAEGPPA